MKQWRVKTEYKLYCYWVQLCHSKLWNILFLFNQWGLFSCTVPYIKSGPKWKFLGTLHCWLDLRWSQIFALLLSYSSEILPLNVLHTVASSGTECLETKSAPTELHRASLSSFVTASTNGYDLEMCFSVNHSLPGWCISPWAIGIIGKPLQ